MNKKTINMLPVTMNQLMLTSVEVSSASHQTQPVSTEATLLRMPCSPSKQNVSSKFLYNFGTGEAKVKSSLKLPSASKLRGFWPMESKMISNPFLPRSGMNLKRVVLTKHIQTHTVYLKRMWDVDTRVKSFEFRELLGKGWEGGHF